MLPPSFFFSSPYAIHIAPPISPPGIKRSGPLQYPRNATIRFHVGFPCEFLLPDSNAIRRNGRRRRNH